MAATARTDFDGFFLFERVPYGHYALRVSAKAAAAAKIAGDLGVTLDVTQERPVVRVGAIQARLPARIASAERGKPASP